tara:strand:+ start:88 stop:474 length:387 start_codon:yes stop_codon:yes gene_type:complete
VAGKEGRLTVNVVTHIDYSKSEPEHFVEDGKQMVSLTFVPHLRLWDNINACLGQSTFNFHNNKKVGTRIYASQELVYVGDVWADVAVGDDDVTYYKTKPEQFKAAASELLNAYVDQLVARIVKAKEKG